MIAAMSDGQVRGILHYFYAPSSAAAAQVAEALDRRGFRTQTRLGADGVNWLVLARHEVIPTEDRLATTRHLMETLIAKVGGEYDGWEAEMRPPA